MERSVTGHAFERVGAIQPERDRSGAIIESRPAPHESLHKYGKGPFCRFTIAHEPGWQRSGVYVLTCGGVARYVGECKNLTMIWNSVGHITNTAVAPRGRQTHCRLNTLILNETKGKEELVLWFEAIEDDEDRSARKAQFLASRNPPWNLVSPAANRAQPRPTAATATRQVPARSAVALPERPDLAQGSAAAERRFGGFRFSYVGPILPERDSRGELIGELPQSRFSNNRNLSLSRYGVGPFCRFRVAQGWKCTGVYVLTRGDDVCYVGEAQDLERRWGPMGYGHISPRACYEGGQDTNCRINNLLYSESKTGGRFQLWFHPIEGKSRLGCLSRAYSCPL